VLYHLQQHQSALKIMNKVFSFIEPMGKFPSPLGLFMSPLFNFLIKMLPFYVDALFQSALGYL
jgi:hypothetical protein